MRTALSILLLVVGTVWVSPRTHACVCEREALADYGPVAELAIRRDFERATVVFIGTMVKRSGGEQHFEVKRVLKGDKRRTVVVHQGTVDGETGKRVLTDCEYDFQFARQYLVYAFGVGTNLWTSYCSRTRLADRAELDLREIKGLLRGAKSNYRLQRSARTRSCAAHQTAVARAR